MPRESGCSVTHKALIYVICHPAHDMKELFFASALCIGNSCLYHVACTVHLMPLFEVRPLLLRAKDCIICVQISVCFLCSPDQIDHRITALLERFIRIKTERIRCALKPFGNITVLKYHPIELTAALSGFDLLGSQAIVFETVTLLYTIYFIIKNSLLIRNNYISYKFLIVSEEASGIFEITNQFHVSLSYTIFMAFSFKYTPA